MFEESLQFTEADDQHQSSLSQAVKHIKKGSLIKSKSAAILKGKNHILIQGGNEPGKAKRIFRRKANNGVVYLRHIPEGFLEDDMRDYFSQFGTVSRVKLCRSEKTGRSKGYAFIEFEHLEVAKIVVETMNNYILFNRLLKAELVPYYRVHHVWGKNFNARDYPGRFRKLQNVKKINRKLTEYEGKRRLSRRLKRMRKISSKLAKKGINYSYLPQVDWKNLKSSKETKNRTNNLKLETKVLEKKEDFTSSGYKAILEVDESDEEIEFKTPPNVIKRKLRVKTGSVSSENSNLKTSGKSINKKTKLANNSTKKVNSLKVKTGKLNKESEVKSLKQKSEQKIVKTLGGKYVRKRNIKN